MDPQDPTNRTNRVVVRLTDEERATLEREARAAGLSLSDFVRSRTLGGRRGARRGPSAKTAMKRAASPLPSSSGPAYTAMNPVLFAELSRIGNNLNQITRAFNSGFDIDRGEVVRLVARAWQTMLRDEVTARYVSMAEAKVRPR